jgi:glycosyltransferase involved in cell wall biosynthesis
MRQHDTLMCLMPEPTYYPKVMVLLSNIGLGGIAVQAKQHAAMLYNCGIANGIYLLNQMGFNDDLRKWYESEIPVDIAPDDFRFSNGLTRIAKYRSVFRARDEKILHFHCFSHEFINWQAVVGAKLAGKKVVATLHHTVAWTRNHRDLSMLGQRLAWRLVDKFIVTTNAGKELVSSAISDKKVCVIPCHVPQPAPYHSTSTSKHKFDVSKKDFVLVSVSRLVKTKGLFDLVRAVSNLVSAFPNLKLIIVGEGPCETELREMARHTGGKVQLVGKVDSVNEFLELADALALPSYEEGFGIVYVEAAHRGVPSIASSLPQVKEVVVDGETGWLVPPGNVKVLEETIASLVTHPEECRRRGENARNYCKKFLPEPVIKQLFAVYCDVG